MRKIACIIAMLACGECKAWYIPCFCGCGLPIEYMVTVQHTAQYALETERSAKLAALLANNLSQLQATVKTYENLRETYDTLGKIRNFTENFDFSKVASTWEIQDWEDLEEVASTLKYATKEWNIDGGNGSESDNPKTETSFLASLLKDSQNITKEAGTDLESLERTLIDINGFNTDSAIRAIIRQEERNAKLKARAAIASQQVKSTDENSKSADGGVVNDSASVADRMDSAALSKAEEAAMWSDMANSFNRNTLMKLDDLNRYLESKRTKLLNEEMDGVKF